MVGVSEKLWCLKVGVYLVFGVWCLSFGVYLVFGTEAASVNAVQLDGLPAAAFDLDTRDAVAVALEGDDRLGIHGGRGRVFVADDDGSKARLGRWRGSDLQTESRRRRGRTVRGRCGQGLEGLAHPGLRADLMRSITVTRRLISSSGLVSGIGMVAPKPATLRI